MWVGASRYEADSMQILQQCSVIHQQRKCKWSEVQVEFNRAENDEQIVALI